VLAVNLAAIAASAPLMAEGLADGLAVSADRALKMGAWTVKTQRSPKAKPSQAGSWHPTVTVTMTVPRRPDKPSNASTAEISHPYGLHGPAPSEIKKPLLAGLASYYGSGERTATGERFDPSGMTAAHRTLPFGTRVKVTRVDTGDSVVVRINDRGPFKRGRVIDLSEGAARSLGIMNVGLADVRLEVLK
jgi:rare lipoprotein A